MRLTFRVAVMLAMLPGISLAGGAQTAPSQTAVSATAPASHPVEGTGSGAGAAATPDRRTEKQKALASQAERLFDMATVLKVEVDKTNRNILSMKVVHEAEEIELLAKGIKEQARK